ncbi:50S ribosomal protein L17 [bacterium BMS3Abin03]|nr:50S ribosomal protein L17 [bacterium BMS3Abin03]
MRHRVKGRKLGRTASHRKATLSALATSLLRHKRIKTTLAKAKETRGYVERLITKARKGDLHSQRQVMDVLKDKEIVKELFAEIVPKVGDRPGGYTRVVKLGTRMGDGAEMAIIELVDYNDIATAKAEERKEEREKKAKEKKETEDKAEAEQATFAEESPKKDSK